MKLTNIIKLSAIALFSITASCGDKKDNHAEHDHAEHDHAEHAGHDHAEHTGHDHGDKKDAHANNDHHKDHTEHDHSNPEHDHSKCGVVVGPKGGRMIEDTAELNLTENGQLTLEFVKAPAADTNVIILLSSEMLELTKKGNTYTSENIADKLPAEIHVSIKNADNKHVEKLQVEAGTCTKCKHAKLACTCQNHDHGDHHSHDH